MKKIRKIIIAGASTFTVKNLGDEAMLLNLVQCIKRYDRKIEIILICRHPSKKIDKLYGIKTIKNLEFDKKSDSVGKYFYGFNSASFSKNLDDIKKNFENSDMLILTGNVFIDISPNSFLRGLSSFTAQMGVLAKFFNLKFYVTSLNVLVKPKPGLTREYLSFFSKNVSKISVRESHSFKYLKEFKFGNKLKKCGETAYGIEIKNDSKVFKRYIKNKKILLNKTNVFGVNVRAEYWDNVNKNIFKKHAKVLSNLAKRTNSTLLFIPNGFYYLNWMDDRIVHKEIIKHLDKDVKFEAINKELNIFEVYNLFSCLNFHYTNRRHSVVFAAMQGSSTAVINTSLKGHLDPLTRDLNIRENLINFSEKDQKIINKIYNLWLKRKKTEVILKRKVKIFKVKARKQFTQLIN